MRSRAAIKLKWNLEQQRNRMIVWKQERGTPIPVCYKSSPIYKELKLHALKRCLLDKYRRDNWVGIALSYGLDDRCSGVRFPAGAGKFSLHHRVQNGSGAHPASYPMGTRASFPGGKVVGAWSWPHTSVYCRGQRMRGAIPPLPTTPSWCGA
jgi:hypothetical protein